MHRECCGSAILFSCFVSVLVLILRVLLVVVVLCCSALFSFGGRLKVCCIDFKLKVQQQQQLGIEL